MGNDKKRKGPNKIVALITYVIALAALILGLFLPFGNLIGKTGTEAMLAMQLPAAIDSLLNPFVQLNLAGTWGTPQFGYTFNILAGWFGEGAVGIDLGAIAVLLYALITVCGIFALIPAIINTVSKKAKKNVALSAASFIEVFALIPLTILVAIQLTFAPVIALGEISGMQWSWALLAAFGGTLLVLVIQSVIYRKHGSGVVKFILALLSGLSLFVAVFDITVFIPALSDTLGSFGLGLNLFTDMPALTPVLGLIMGQLTWASDSALWATAYIGAMALGLLLFINFMLDVMGLGKKTNRLMLAANVIRYALEVIAAILVIVIVIFIEGVDIGLYSIVIAALAAVALIINIIRLVVYKPHRAKASAKVAEGGAAEETETKKQKKQREKEERKAQKEAEKAAKEASKNAVVAEEAATAEPAAASAPAEPVSVYSEDSEGNVVYKPIIYDGPSDDFIKLLTNEQKLEFSRVFLERSGNPLSCIPQYNVGGKNDKFFSSVFIYYGKVRDLVSDGLMNEIYKQVNAM
ncbi:MAG: hypothetical protein K2L42_06165 [Clostridia bacterium]|nr:hypothetical protein [Clostridia bacterium]